MAKRGRPRKNLRPRKALKKVLPIKVKIKRKRGRQPKGSQSRVCDICDKTFATPRGCQRHKILHSETPIVTCTYCKQQFKRREDWKLHLIRTGHINFLDKQKDEDGKLEEGEMERYIDKVLSCEFCSMIFDRNSNFKAHMRVHVNEVPGEEGPPPPTGNTKNKHALNSAPDKGLPLPTLESPVPVLDNRGVPLPGHTPDVINKVSNALGAWPRDVDPNFRGDPNNMMPQDFTNLLYKTSQGNSVPMNMMPKTATSVAPGGANDLAPGDKPPNPIGTHEGDKLVCYSCPYCNFFSYQEAKLTDHEKTHEGERPYQCDVCKKTFTVDKTLEQHMARHSEDKAHCCESCGKTYPSISQLYAHEYTHIGISNFKCDRCAASFTSKAGLERHMNFHDGKRDHVCDQCGKSFFSKGEVTGHIRVHHKKKVFVMDCEICKKPFVSRGELNKHMTVHSDERPFMCACCGKGFSRKIYLNQHMVIHTMERPYKCSQCPKAFKFVSNLQTHERIHTGEKPYSCDVCGKRSSDVGNHHKHMKIHKKDTNAPSISSSKPASRQQYHHHAPQQPLQQPQQPQQQHQQLQQQHEQQQHHHLPPPPQHHPHHQQQQLPPLPPMSSPPILQQPPPQQEPLNLNPAAFDPSQYHHMMEGGPPVSVSPYEAYRRHTEFPWASFARP